MLPKLLLMSSLAALPQSKVVLSVADTGVSAAALADTPETLPINMEAVRLTNVLSLILRVTPGDSTGVVVTCYESDKGSVWAQMVLCDYGEPSSSCKPDSRTYTLSDWTAAADGNYYLPTHWSSTKELVKCSVDDPGDGTGTVSVTGDRTYR